MRAIAREAARSRRAQEKFRTQQAAAQRRALREAEIRTKADAKEAARAHVAAQIDEAETLTREAQAIENAIGGLLRQGLLTEPVVSLDSMLTEFLPGHFDENRWEQTAPELAAYLPQPPGFFARLMPGSTERHQRQIERGTKRYESAQSAYSAARAERDAAWVLFDQFKQQQKANVERNNNEILAFKQMLMAGEHGAVLKYFKLVLDKSLNGEPDALSAEVGYSQDSKHLVIDIELPEFSIIPEESSFKYVKSTDRIDAVVRPLAKRKAFYSNLISQISLKCIDTVFRGDAAGVVACLTLNGMLDTIDPATGQEVRVCLLSVRVDTDTFRTLNLNQVQPEYCLRSLKALISRAPTDLVPVKPISRP